MEVILDRFGRIVIPKQIRQDLGLRPGTALQVEEHPREVIFKLVVGGQPNVILDDGVLVYAGTASGDILGAIRGHRQERFGKLGHMEKR